MVEELLVISYRCLLARYPRRIVFMYIIYRDVVDRRTLKGGYTITEQLPSSVRAQVGPILGYWAPNRDS